jgi:hypothetical protein
MLFDLLRGPAAGLIRTGVYWRQLVCAVGGTMMCCPDTAANLMVRRRGGGNHGGTSYPMVRLLALAACGTRTVIAATFAGRRVLDLPMGRIGVRVIRRDPHHHQRRLPQRGLPTGHHASGAQPHHRLSRSRVRHPVPPALGDRDRVLRVEVDHSGRARAARPYPGRHRAGGLRPAGDLSGPADRDQRRRARTPRPRSPPCQRHRRPARRSWSAPRATGVFADTVVDLVGEIGARSWSTSCPAADRAPTPAWSNERSPNTSPAPSQDATADPPAQQRSTSTSSRPPALDNPTPGVSERLCPAPLTAGRRGMDDHVDIVSMRRGQRVGHGQASSGIRAELQSLDR